MIRKIPVIMGIITGSIIGLYLAINNQFDDFFRILFSIRTLYIIIFLMISYVIVVNVHEFGHFIFGKLSGYKLLKYKLGIFALELENNKYKLIIEKIKGFDGACLMTPTKSKISRRNSLILYSGGLIMNLITVIIIGIIFLLRIELTWELYNFLLVLMIFSGFALINNIIPFKSYNNPNDGFIILELIKNSDISKKLMNINIYLKKLLSGIRPKDIEELNEIVIDEEKIDVMEIYELMHLLYNAIDKNDKKEIKKLVDILVNNKEKIPSLLEMGLNSELCYCYSILDDLGRAKDYYNKTKNKLESSNDSSSNRIKAYYEFNFDRNKSLEYCNKGLALIDVYPIKGIAIMEKELLMNLKKELS